MPTNTHKFKQIYQPARLAAQQPAQVASFSEDLSEVLRNLRHTCGHTAKDITPSIARRREAWKEEALDDLSLKGRERAIVNQTNIGTVSRATLGKLLREVHKDFFRAHRTELNWTVTLGLVGIRNLCSMQDGNYQSCNWTDVAKLRP